MTVDTKASYKARVDAALSDAHLHTALDRATNRLTSNRTKAMAEIDADRLRSETNAVRRHAVSNLADLLEDLERNLIANGCHVHWARDADEANQIARFLQLRTQMNFHQLILTHHHMDHVYGLFAFPENIDVIGHKLCREMLLHLGEESLVLEGKVAGFFNWCLWRDYIFYISQEEGREPSIEMFNFRSGETLPRLHTLGEGTIIGNGLSVSPDGLWILYSEIERSGDLMLVENFY